jgi:hypothetical protein
MYRKNQKLIANRSNSYKMYNVKKSCETHSPGGVNILIRKVLFP